MSNIVKTYWAVIAAERLFTAAVEAQARQEKRNTLNVRYDSQKHNAQVKAAAKDRDDAMRAYLGAV